MSMPLKNLEMTFLKDAYCFLSLTDLLLLFFRTLKVQANHDWSLHNTWSKCLKDNGKLAFIQMWFRRMCPLRYHAYTVIANFFLKILGPSFASNLRILEKKKKKKVQSFWHIPYGLPVEQTGGSKAFWDLCNKWPRKHPGFDPSWAALHLLKTGTKGQKFEQIQYISYTWSVTWYCFY